MYIRTPRSVTIREFQFLIGWLQTNTEQYYLYRQKQFQFLIGWLQTGIINWGILCVFIGVSIPYRLATNLSFSYRSKEYFEFQFLIGWLQTQLNSAVSSLVTFVSIPYRLATNRFKGLSSGDKEATVSIPYRLATNTSCGEGNFFECSWFQFLIGWLQTDSQTRYTRKQACSFQFLIGWLQTYIGQEMS